MQNVGVKAPSLPSAVRERAATESFGTPEQMEGWTWTSLDDRTFLDLGDLDAIAAQAAGEAAAPSLAFSVHDSDSVYVVGADTTGVRFRLMVNPEAWEDEPPPQEIDGAVDWAKDHGALDPSAEEIAAVVARTFVFGEESLDILFAQMGLLPAEAAKRAHELDDFLDQDPAEVWARLESVESPEKRILERGRWHATLQHGDVRGHLLAAEEDTRTLWVTGERLEYEWIPEKAVTSFVVRVNEPTVFLGQASTREELWDDLARQGVMLGSWQEVPHDVLRDLASTAAWVLAYG